MEQSGKKRTATTIAVVLILIIAVLGIILLTKKKANKNLEASSPSSNTSTNQNASTTSDSAALKDGTYTATGSYTSPGGNESITIKVTLKDSVVTDTSAISGANDPTAQQHQNEFIGGYKDQVVGKKITTIKLSRVSGSSLTSQGFNSAIQQIKQQAQA